MADDVLDLAGTVNFRAVMLDGSEIDVAVRQLRLRELPKLADCIGDEAAMLKLCTSLSEAQIDSISLKSAEGLVTLCERLNMDFFQRWLERQLRRNEAVVPGVRAKIAAAVDSALPTTSPRSRPDAG